MPVDGLHTFGARAVPDEGNFAVEILEGRIRMLKTSTTGPLTRGPWWVWQGGLRPPLGAAEQRASIWAHVQWSEGGLNQRCRSRV
eukprot:5943864-Alexandrium_andersonii.AAC.1